jgi:hypothetical protein
MHAVVVKVRVNDEEGATKALHEQVVPTVSAAPGFVAGYWIRLGDSQGTSVVVFESEEGARNVAQGIAPPPGDAVAIESVTVGEVIANA